MRRKIHPREITREQANEILVDASKGPMQRATICYGGKWWDVRGVDTEVLKKFINKLVGKNINL